MSYSFNFLVCQFSVSEGYDGYKVEELVKDVRQTRRTNETQSGRHRHDKNETEFWGYMDVRPGAHMFYWLYRSSHADGYLQRPLIMWIMVRHPTSIMMKMTTSERLSRITNVLN